MKPFKDNSFTENAALFHQWFPDLMPGLIDFIKGVCEAIREDQHRGRTQWQNAFYDFDYWLELLGTVEDRINRYGQRLHTAHDLFATQLFDGDKALFTVHCMRMYVTVRRHPDHKFAKAFDLLFNP